MAFTISIWSLSMTPTTVARSVPFLVALFALTLPATAQPATVPEIVEQVRTWRVTHELEILGELTTLLEIPNVAGDREDIRRNAEHLYPDDSLRRARSFEAVELNSGILLNDGQGRFDWRPLPRLAQASPGYGMVASDYNGDGHIDLYLVQNSFSREPETGLLDGGASILLFGDGSGDFRVSDPSESGLMVPGDGKGLAGGDLNRDGWSDVVLTKNNGPLAAYGNHGVAGNASLAVRLQGLPGNPGAVDARMTLERYDGHRQTSEIYAGSGYLSQSSPTRFFGLGTAEAKHLWVRWPDGSETRHPAGPGPNLILVHPRDGLRTRPSPRRRRRR